MTRPVFLRGVPPKLTEDAVKYGIEGTMFVKCVLSAVGSLRDCRIVKGLPFMNEAVLAVLPQWRFVPATFRGRPVELELVVPIKLVGAKPLP